jgi:hypothetical protein
LNLSVQPQLAISPHFTARLVLRQCLATQRRELLAFLEKSHPALIGRA